MEGKTFYTLDLMTKLFGLLIVTVGIEFITRREFSIALFLISAGTLLTLLPVYLKARKSKVT